MTSSHIEFQAFPPSSHCAREESKRMCLVDMQLHEDFLLLEPKPIHTNRMKIVDKLDVTDTLLALSGHLFSTPDCHESTVLSQRVDGEHRLNTAKRVVTPSNKGMPLTRHSDVPCDILASYKAIGQHSRDQNHEDRWNERYTELKNFVRRNGHAHVPVRYQANLPLSKWCKRQRYQWRLKYEGKHSTLSDSRESKLNALGFLWDIRLTVWEERFQELLQFKEKHGHCFVPISYNEYPKLGTWVKCQRRHWKLRCSDQQSSMTPERIAKLEAIGFSWEARST